MSEPDDFWQNPYPTYTALRRRGTVDFDDDIEAWIVTGHRAASAALSDPALSSRWLRGPLYDRASGAAIEHVREWLIWQDPPQHPVLRRHLASLFTARTTGARSADIQARVRAGYQRFVRSGGGDAVANLALPVVSELVADLVGLAEVDHGVLRRWSAAAGVLMARSHHAPTRAAADEALAAMTAAMTEHASEHHRGGAAGGRVVLDRAGDELPGGSALHLASLFAFAGIETTTQAAVRLVELAATGALPAQARPGEVVAATLRYDTPVPQVPRVAVRDTRLLGHSVAAGDHVVVMLAAANHDPEVFTDPERPTSLADSARHLSYGHGRHRCLGAPLADTVLACLVDEMRRHPAPRLAGPPVWHHDRGHRGIARLDVVLDPDG